MSESSRASLLYNREAGCKCKNWNYQTAAIPHMAKAIEGKGFTREDIAKLTYKVKTDGCPLHGEANEG